MLPSLFLAFCVMSSAPDVTIRYSSHNAYSVLAESSSGPLACRLWMVEQATGACVEFVSPDAACRMEQRWYPTGRNYYRFSVTEPPLGGIVMFAFGAP